jgi:transposase InsO family protein
LVQLFVERRTSEYIRSDQGPEFAAEAVRDWLARVRVQTLFMERGSPRESGYIESFSGKLRDELLDREVFDTLKQARGGELLSAQDCIVSADEKTTAQAWPRIRPTRPPSPQEPARVEHEYESRDAWAYLAWDARSAKILGRCECRIGIAPFRHLVRQVMSVEPYRSVPRVFWILDNGSSHRGQACIERLTKAWSNIVVVHTPVHASWLNQVDIYFSIVQRKVLTPNDFRTLAALHERLLKFRNHYEQIASPFQWKITRREPDNLIPKLSTHQELRKAA